MLARSEFSQVRKSQHDFALLSVVCHALIVSRGFQHTIPRNLAAELRGDRAAFACPSAAAHSSEVSSKGREAVVCSARRVRSSNKSLSQHC